MGIVPKTRKCKSCRPAPSFVEKEISMVRSADNTGGTKAAFSALTTVWNLIAFSEDGIED